MQCRVDRLQCRDTIHALLAKSCNRIVTLVGDVSRNDISVSIVQVTNEAVEFTVEATAGVDNVIARSIAGMAFRQNAAGVLNQL